MRTIALVGAFALGVVTTLLGARAVTPDDGHAAPAPPAEDMATMMAKWRAVASPGSSHALLDGFVGSWETTTRIWMSGPRGPVSETSGTAEVEWTLDRRFILARTDSAIELPDPAGGTTAARYEGLSLTGYDNFRNRFVACAADSMNTHLLTMTGSADRAGRTITFYGTMDEPMLGVHGRMVKYVNRIVDPDTLRLEIIDLDAGDDQKVVEITYRRRAGDGEVRRDHRS